jgi:hypothetical protein
MIAMDTRGRCCVAPVGGALKPHPHLGSDRHGEFIERDGQPPVHRLLDGRFVMALRVSLS